MEVIYEVPAPALDLATASRGLERAFGYAVMAAAVVAAEILIATEAVLHRTVSVPWR